MLIVGAAVLAVLLGLAAPAGAERVEISPAKGLIRTAAASYDGSGLTAEIAVRRTGKRVDLFVVAVDTGGRRGADRTIYVRRGNVEIENADLVLVPCAGAAATQAKRSVKVSVPATCLGLPTPARVRAQWAVWWHRWVAGTRRCGVSQVPADGSFGPWLDAPARRGC